MNIPSTFTVGTLPVIAGTVIFMAATVMAGDKPSAIGPSMEPKPKVVVQERLNVKDLDELTSHMEVIDAKGNAYLLIPIKPGAGTSAVTSEGKITVEYVHPYMEPVNR